MVNSILVALFAWSVLFLLFWILLSLIIVHHILCLTQLTWLRATWSSHYHVVRGKWPFSWVPLFIALSPHITAPPVHPVSSLVPAHFASNTSLFPSLNYLLSLSFSLLLFSPTHLQLSVMSSPHGAASDLPPLCHVHAVLSSPLAPSPPPSQFLYLFIPLLLLFFSPSTFSQWRPWIALFSSG